MENITLVIPAKNESESLPIVLDELEKYACKKIIVLEQKDYSTLNSLKDRNCKIIIQKKSGYGSAINEGISNSTTKYSCIFNADGSFDPTDLDKMKNEIDSGSNFVFASRYEGDGGSEDDTIITFIGNKIFSLLGKIFFSLKITDILYTYVLFETQKYNSLNLRCFDFRLCVELPIKAQHQGYKLSSIGCYERKRIAGKKKVNAFKDGFLILCKIVNLFFSKK
jgi:glycosyltransferase involved in cell wall biosynthesis